MPINLRHRSLVIFTGTSINGLGFECVRVIAKYANLVIITGYNKERFVQEATPIFPLKR